VYIYIHFNFSFFFVTVSMYHNKLRYDNVTHSYEADICVCDNLVGDIIMSVTY